MDGLLISPGHVGLIGIAGSQNKPAFLGASGLWGFTASPTPQYAHFGRATNKAGALASTRNSEAYNLAGTQLFPVNDPVVSAMTGLEGWSAVTNLLLRSQEFDNAEWAKLSSTTVTANAAAAPNGTTTADKLVAPGGQANPRVVSNNIGAISNGQVVTLFCFAKAAEVSIVRLTVVRTNEAAISGFTQATFNLSSQVATGTGASLVALADGWFLCVVTQTASESVADARGRVAFGDGVALVPSGHGVLVWGAQLSFTGFAFPYVPTAASTATRLADNTTIPDWQSFVERYSLLDGLTVSGTLNIDRLSAANNSTIFQAGSANEFARLDFTTGNRFRMTLQTLGPELRGTGTTGLVGSATAATYDTSTGVGSAARVDVTNQSYVQFGSVATYLVNITNTGSKAVLIRNNPSGNILYTIPVGNSFIGEVVISTGIFTIAAGTNGDTANFTVNSIRQVVTHYTLESGVVGATGLYDISARFKPSDYALTVSGGIAGGTDASAETLPDAIRTNPAYVGRDIAGSLHWNGNIPELIIGKAA